MDTHISLIVLNYNGAKDTIACLESLRALDYSHFTVILIDNASQEADLRVLQNALPSFPFVHFITNTTNLGFAGGCNQGISIALDTFQSSYVYLLNNDTEVDSQMLQTAVAQMERDPQIGIVASQSRLHSTPHLLDNSGHTFLDCGDVIPRGRGVEATSYPNAEFVMGACGAGMLIRSEVLQDVGLLSEEFFINFEDVEFGLRAIMYGWDCIYEPNSVIYHKINASIAKVRSYDFNVRSQLNQLRAYWYNMPLSLIFCNAPFILLRDLGVLLLCTCFLRFRILRVFLHARYSLLREWQEIARIRRHHKPHWRRSTWFLLRHQRSFLSTYLRYARQILLSRQKSVLELEV